MVAPKIPGGSGKAFTRSDILGGGAKPVISRADKIIDSLIKDGQIQSAVAEHIIPRIGTLMEAAKDQISKPGPRGGNTGKTIDLSKKGKMDGRPVYTAGGRQVD